MKLITINCIKPWASAKPPAYPTKSARTRAHRFEITPRSGDGERQHLHQLSASADVRPVGKNLLGLPAARSLVVFDSERVDPFVIDVIALDPRYARRVQFRGHFAVRIVDHQFAAGHPRTDFIFDRAEHEHAAASHIFAGILPGRLGYDGAHMCGAVSRSPDDWTRTRVPVGV